MQGSRPLIRKRVEFGENEEKEGNTHGGSGSSRFFSSGGLNDGGNLFNLGNLFNGGSDGSSGSFGGRHYCRTRRELEEGARGVSGVKERKEGGREDKEKEKILTVKELDRERENCVQR